MVHPVTVGELLSSMNSVLDLPVHRVGGPQRSCELQLLIYHVDGDDLPGSHDARALNDGEADTTQAKDRHGRTRLDLRRVQHRAQPGGDTAAQQCRLVEREVLGDLHHSVLENQHLLSKRAEIEELTGLLATHRYAGGGPLRAMAGFTAVYTIVSVALLAVRTLVASDCEIRDHMVSWLHVLNVCSDSSDDSRRLVSEDCRKLK